MNIKLNKRLTTISAFIENNSKVIDIGCDHGLLGIYLYETKDNIKVISSDINELPLKKAHDKANRSKLWADVEVFTFEGDVYKSALLPANIERLKKQLEAVSPYVEEILIFEYQGMFNKPGTIAFCGHPDSIEYYKDYKKLLDEIEK